MILQGLEKQKPWSLVTSALKSTSSGKSTKVRHLPRNNGTKFSKAGKQTSAAAQREAPKPELVLDSSRFEKFKPSLTSASRPTKLKSPRVLPSKVPAVKNIMGATRRTLVAKPVSDLSKSRVQSSLGLESALAKSMRTAHPDSAPPNTKSSRIRPLKARVMRSKSRLHGIPLVRMCRSEKRVVRMHGSFKLDPFRTPVSTAKYPKNLEYDPQGFASPRIRKFVTPAMVYMRNARRLLEYPLMASKQGWDATRERISRASSPQALDLYYQTFYRGLYNAHNSVSSLYRYHSNLDMVLYRLRTATRRLNGHFDPIWEKLSSLSYSLKVYIRDVELLRVIMSYKEVDQRLFRRAVSVRKAMSEYKTADIGNKATRKALRLEMKTSGLRDLLHERDGELRRFSYASNVLTNLQYSADLPSGKLNVLEADLRSSPALYYAEGLHERLHVFVVSSGSLLGSIRQAAYSIRQNPDFYLYKDNRRSHAGFVLRCRLELVMVNTVVQLTQNCAALEFLNKELRALRYFIIRHCDAHHLKASIERERREHLVLVRRRERDVREKSGRLLRGILKGKSKTSDEVLTDAELSFIMSGSCD